MWTTIPKALIPSSADLMAMISAAEAKCDAARKAAIADRAESAFAHNRRARRAAHDNYLVSAGQRCAKR
jgi:hypothetical protein